MRGWIWCRNKQLLELKHEVYSVLQRAQSQLWLQYVVIHCDNIATIKIVIIAVVIKLLQFCDNIELMANPRVSLAKPFIYYSHTVYAFLCTGCELYINWCRYFYKIIANSYSRHRNGMCIQPCSQASWEWGYKIPHRFWAPNLPVNCIQCNAYSHECYVSKPPTKMGLPHISVSHARH